MVSNGIFVINCTMTLSIMTTLSVMTFSIMTLNTVTLRIMALSINGLFATLSITFSLMAECCYAE